MPDILKNASPVVVDKAASYTVEPQDNGKIIVATAAATLTLPPVANVWNGWNVTCYNAANTSMVVSAPTGTLVTMNDLACNSVAYSTTNEKVGGCVRIVYDLALTKYLAFLMPAAESQTVTYAT
jgi:hypothetical protein